MNQGKIVVVGMQRTGTTTMGEALLILGYSVLATPNQKNAIKIVEFGASEALKQLSPFDACQDLPWLKLYKEIDQEFPNSKFIATMRDETSWMSSMLTHFGKNATPLRKWAYGEGCPTNNESLYIENFKNHYVEVFDYFKNREDDFLVMDFKKGDGWEKLCNFLNKPVPKVAFPHTNKAAHNYTFKEKTISLLKKITPEWLRSLRIDLLVKLGYPDNRKRFNNEN